MKNFEYAKAKKEKKKFKMPTVVIGKYEYNIWAMLLFPLILISLLVDKIKDWNYNRLEWSTEKATKVLDNWLPYVLEYDEGAYWYCTDWNTGSWNIAKKVPIGLKQFTTKFTVKIFAYLRNEYEKMGFEKTIEENDYESLIKFTPKV